MEIRRTERQGLRVFLFFGLALLFTGCISILFADLLWRKGWTSGSTILIALFIPLMFFNSVGAMHGIFGFVLRRFGDSNRITASFAKNEQELPATAILFPIYNEEAADVYARLRVAYESLERTGQAEAFDFYILSDATDPEKWIDEESRWWELIKELDAAGRIFYRRRIWNEGKKSGNIRDFLTEWGNRYRYFIVFDADSFMTGQTLLKLVKLMEANPGVGLIQTPPAAINAESLFGRLHQFANRLYGPLFTAGSNFWTLGYGNYVGHNAIIRTAPFMKHCDLPQLPGKKPFGGQILSHDFAEAALLVKNNWEVWQAYDIEESYEEVPQGLIEYAQRDRRWCQGNMQHILVVFGRGLRGISRMHFVFGIFGFLSGPIWLLFLLAFNAQVLFQRQTGLSDITVKAWTPFLSMNPTAHALFIFALSALVLFTPRILALIDLALDRERARKFGGAGRAAVGALLELIFSTLQAPILMLWHTQFVLSTFLGRSVSWGQQNRQADGTSWAAAFREHWKHMLIGIVWGAMIWRIDPALLGWFAPVLLGILSSMPLTVLTSRKIAGRSSLFLTPEETEPNRDICLLREALAGASESNSRPTVEDVITDSRLNALHVALLTRDAKKDALEKLGRGLPPVKSLRNDLKRLKGKELLAVMSDLESVRILRRERFSA